MHIILRLFFTIFFLLAGIVYIITATPQGLQFSFAMIGNAIPGQLLAKNLRGNLSHFTADQLTYSNHNQTYYFTDVSVKWLPFELLNKHIVINQIRSNKITALHHNKILAEMDSVDIIRKIRNIYTIKGHLLDGNLTGSAKIDFLPPFKLTSSLFFEKLDMGLLSQKITGKINFKLDSQINTYPDNTKMDFNLSQLQGDINHYPIKGSTIIHHDKDGLEIESSELMMNNGYARIAGFIKEKINLTWNIHFKGSLETTGTITGSEKHPIIEGRFKAHNLAIAPLRIGEMNGSIHALSEQNSKIDVFAKNIFINNYPIPALTLHSDLHYLNEHLSSKITLLADNQASLKGNLTLSKSNALQGLFDFHFANFKIIQAFTDEITNVKGNLDSKIALSGTLQKPELMAEVKLNQGEVVIPRLAISLKKIMLNGHYRNNLLLTTGSFLSGNGSGNLESKLEISPAIKMEVKLNGKNLQLADLQEYKIIATPDLLLSLNDEKINLSGKVFIPKATISPTNFADVSTLSEDVVFVNQPSAKSFIPNTIFIQMNIVLGDAITLNYEKLNADVVGSVVLSQTPGRPPIAIGELTLKNGTYKAYGQTLTVENGRIIYTGNNLYNPGLVIKADRSLQLITTTSTSQFNSTNLPSGYAGTDNVKVGVDVSRTIKNPLMTLFSSPAGLSQNDILSYLLFGYPQSELSSDNKLGLLSAAASLKLGELGTGFTDRIKKFTGLSEFNVESLQIFNPDTNTTQNTTTLSLGKKLSDKLSIRYHIGLYTSDSIWNIQYQLTKRISVQTETSNLENAADVIYRFERD